MNAHELSKSLFRDVCHSTCSVSKAQHCWWDFEDTLLAAHHASGRHHTQALRNMGITPVLPAPRWEMPLLLCKLLLILGLLWFDDSFKNLTHYCWYQPALSDDISTETLFTFTKEIALHVYENWHQVPYSFWFVCYPRPPIKKSFSSCFLHNVFSTHWAIWREQGFLSFGTPPSFCSVCLKT